MVANHQYISFNHFSMRNNVLFLYAALLFSLSYVSKAIYHFMFEKYWFLYLKEKNGFMCKMNCKGNHAKCIQPKKKKKKMKQTNEGKKMTTILLYCIYFIQDFLFFYLCASFIIWYLLQFQSFYLPTLAIKTFIVSFLLSF